MGRIVRLTESDLARIVRRVIREQEETTAMSPVSYDTIKLGTYDFMVKTKAGGVIQTKIAPSKYTEKNDKGIEEVVPGVLHLEIQNKAGFTAGFNWDCKKNSLYKTVGVSKPSDLDTFNKNYTIYAAGRDSSTTDTNTLISNTWTSSKFQNKGAIAEMTAKYCSMV
jgi:hypothetical protein